MKRLLSLPVFAVLLMSAICSCRSSRQSASEYSDSASVLGDYVREARADDEILSIISASRELDMSGITVEFYPPDSTRPYCRAAPKAVAIENAKAKAAIRLASHETTAADELQTANIAARSSASLKQDTNAVSGISRPGCWAFGLTAAIAFCYGLFCLYRHIRNR